MKVTSVDLYSSKGDLTAELSLNDPGVTKPYVVKTIIGLDADEISPVYYAKGAESGDLYHSLNLTKRDVIIRILLNPDYSIGQSPSSLRDHIYRIISASRTGVIQLRFKNEETHVATISGFVTKFEAPHFSEIPEVQITIQTDDPMLRGASKVSNEYTTVPHSTGFGSIITITDNISTAPHGMTMEVVAKYSTSTFAITDGNFGVVAGLAEWGFSISWLFAEGHSILFGNEYNNKHAYTKAGVGADLVPCADVINYQSVWPTIFPGTNSFFLYPGWDIVKLEYTPVFWGI